MLPIIVVLLVAWIVVPLIDLTLNETVRVPVKVVVYVVALLFILFILITGKMLLP